MTETTVTDEVKELDGTIRRYNRNLCSDACAQNGHPDCLVATERTCPCWWCREGRICDTCAADIVPAHDGIHVYGAALIEDKHGQVEADLCPGCAGADLIAATAAAIEKVNAKRRIDNAPGEAYAVAKREINQEFDQVTAGFRKVRNEALAEAEKAYRAAAGLSPLAADDPWASHPF